MGGTRGVGGGIKKLDLTVRTAVGFFGVKFQLRFSLFKFILLSLFCEVVRAPICLPPPFPQCVCVCV